MPNFVKIGNKMRALAIIGSLENVSFVLCRNTEIIAVPAEFLSK